MVDGGCISICMKDRGLSCLGPFPKSEGRHWEKGFILNLGICIGKWMNIQNI